MSAPGDLVQTPFGKGVVRELRNNGRLLVDINGRAMELKDVDVSPTAEARPRSRRATQQPESPARRAGPADSPVEIDLHGMTVAEALARAEQALNDALLADAAEVRFIHGRSGGRIRSALHQRLKEIPSVRGFRLDPRNEGVTIVVL